MSTKGSIKSQQSALRNSFGILSSLEDNHETPKTKKTSTNSKETKAAPAHVIKTEVKKAPAPSSNSSEKKTKESVPAKKITNKPKSIVEAVKQEAKTANNVAASASHSSAGSVFKMLIFAVLMLVLPIGAYYWSVNQAGLDLGEIKSALIAVLVVNVLLFLYILMAFLEESKQPKAKKN